MQMLHGHTTSNIRHQPGSGSTAAGPLIGQRGACRGPHRQPHPHKPHFKYLQQHSHHYNQTAARAASPGSGDPTAASPDAAAAPTGSTASNNANSTAAAAAAAAGPPADAVSQARRDLSASWQLLRDAAATAFVPGHKQRAAAAERRAPLRYSDLLQQQQQQQQQQDEIVSLPERFGRLFSGQFIREREARSKGLAADAPGQQQQQGDTQFAAMQFEVLKRLQQQQQQPAEGASTPATAAAAAAAAAAVTVGADGIIEVSVEPQPAAAAADTTSQTTPPPAAAAATNEAFYPASTTVLVLCSWAVFGLQWVQALPDLWGVVTSGRLLDAAAGLLLAFPDAPATRGMMLDLTALQAGHGWLGLLTSGLCNSGLISTWLCCAALQTTGRFLEAGTGQLQLLTIFLICTLSSSLAHIFAGRCAMGVTGPGAVLGVYTTWTIVATRYMRNVVPLRTIYIQGVLLLLLLLGLGLLQPAVSAASLLGGIIGGAVAVVAVEPVAAALKWALALPAMAGLVLLRLLIDLVQVLWFSVVLVAAAAWQLVTDTVSTVRRL